MFTVDGKPFATHAGKVFIYFFNPECMHCFDAAKKMSKMNFGDTKVVGVPVEQIQFAGQFLQDTGFKAGVSNDLQTLRKLFPFVNAPAAVALVNGREKAMITQFDDAVGGFGSADGDVPVVCRRVRQYHLAHSGRDDGEPDRQPEHAR